MEDSDSRFSILDPQIRIVCLDGDAAVIARQSAKNPTIHIGSKNFAYVIYTSGSTGQPKGIAIEHRNAVAFLWWTNSAFSRAELAAVAASTSICFDLSIFELFAPLSCGGKVILAQDALDLAERIERNDITLVNTVPSAMNELLAAGGLPRSARTVNLAGEPLTPELVRQLYATGTIDKVYDLYGPSETTTYSTFALRRAHGRATIGRPVANTQIYLLDAALQPVPVGVPGEIFIGGAGVARGYLHRPELTAEKFLADPFARRSGARMYRTGDLGRYDSNGNIEYLGRSDNQVKIRGYRIELGEIEAALAAHPAVRECVAVARKSAEPSDNPKSKIRNLKSDTQLLAYFVPTAGILPSTIELRDFLREKLPEFMLPSVFMPVEALPLTPNGKVDRPALPKVDADAGRVTPEFAAPRNELEEVVAQVWREVLDTERFGVFDDFFDLGGHSLLAVRVVARLRRTFGVELPLRGLFEARTVAGLAREIDALRSAGRGVALAGIVSARRPGPVPLSFAQRRLWFLHKLEPDLAAYNMPAAHRIHGPLHVALFERALHQIIRRHEVLRSAVVEIGGEPMQQIQPNAALHVPVIDLSALPAEQGEREVARYSNEDAEQPFDLATAPLMRAKVLRLGGREHVLLLNFHHIVCDGWSLAVLYREVAALYESFSQGREGALAPLPAQYADFAVWQQHSLQTGQLEPQMAYWRRQLGGVARVDLPADWERPLAQTYRGGKVSRRLSRDLTAALKALARKEHATLFMMLLAALAIVLSRLAARDEMVVGSTIAGRNRPELEGLIGFFINALPLRVDLSGNLPFVELLERVVEDLNPQRDLSRNPIFQVLFNMVDISERELKLSGCTTVKLQRAAPGAKFDLVFHAPEIDGAIDLELVYNADLFAEARARAMLEQWSHLLSQIIEAPTQRLDQFSLVPPAAKEILPDPTERLDDRWYGSIHAWLARHARERPEKAAVVDARESWSYEELDRWSDRLAQYLLQRGVRPKDVVAIYAHRDASLALALYGILKAGAAFAILDPAYPPARLVDYLRLAQPTALLEMECASGLGAELEAYVGAAAGMVRVRLPRAKTQIRRLLARAGAAAPNIAVASGDPAYIAFTSGSTGLPKGVLCRHGPITHFLPWQSSTFDLRDADRYALLSGLGYNHLHRDLFTALALGATLRVPAEQDLQEPQRLARWLDSQEISVLHLTPALGRLLQTAAGKSLPSMRRIFFGGDLLLRQDVLAMRELAPNAELVSFYGATETQRAVGYFVIGDALLKSDDRARRAIPIGRGAPDVQLLLLTPGGLLAGIGEVGELYIRSPHLAAGYAGDRELSGANFVLNPFTGDARDRLYRTRELGRYLPDGNVEWLGRNDRRASIRGFRVELAEVETALRRCPGVRHAAAVAERVVDEASGGDARLVAYVECAEDRGVGTAALRDFLTARLPRYMIPAEFHFVERMPLNPNGKIDYAGLSRVEPLQLRAGGSFEAPRNNIERVVAKIFAEVLRLERIGRQDNFFEQGGHSLLAAKAAARLRETLGVELHLRTFLELPTVEAICRRIEAAQTDGGARLQFGEREEIEL
jgi:amino acid adenylation domain-containing protein